MVGKIIIHMTIHCAATIYVLVPANPVQFNDMRKLDVDY